MERQWLAVVVWSALGVVACGAKTGLRVPEPQCIRDVATVSFDAASCGYVMEPPIERPVARVVREQSTRGDTWCEHAHPVALAVPNGFCASLFARIRGPRVLAFSPDGVLFVSSASRGTLAGVIGEGMIARITDPELTGRGQVAPFMLSSSVHGLAFSSTALYFTTENAVRRVAYRQGMTTAEERESEMVADLSLVEGLWSHPLALSSDGRLLVGAGFVLRVRGGPDITPIHSIFEVQNGRLIPYVRGLRNAPWIRCHPTDPQCWASSTAADQLPGLIDGLVQLRACADHGYPRCEQRNSARGDDCGSVNRYDFERPTGSTPFGFDWEQGIWPEPYRRGLVLAQHGSFYDVHWPGTGIYFASRDACTGEISREFHAFSTDFGHLDSSHGEPARATDVLFAPDGRLFVSDDQGGNIYWIAPVTLRR